MGEVILGLPGPWAEDYRERADHYTCKIGGLPDWPEGEFAIQPKLLQCSSCGSKLCLVSQIYSPVHAKDLTTVERIIYILACPEHQCAMNSHCWKAFRVQTCVQGCNQVDDPCSNAETAKDGPSERNCRSEDNDDEDDDIDLNDLAQSLQEAFQQACKPTKHNVTKTSSAAGVPCNDISKAPAVELEAGAICSQRTADSSKVLPCFYLYCEKEKSSGKTAVIKRNNELRSLNGAEDSDGERWEGEAHEYDRALGADRTYLKFKKRLDMYPEQCFRYSYAGSPLLAKDEIRRPGVCKLCGAARHFELQLMPPLLYFLQEAVDETCWSPDSWTWINLAVYTCSKSCCPSLCAGETSNCRWGVVEEEIMIQED